MRILPKSLGLILALSIWACLPAALVDAIRIISWHSGCSCYIIMVQQEPRWMYCQFSVLVFFVSHFKDLCAPRESTHSIFCLPSSAAVPLSLNTYMECLCSCRCTTGSVAVISYLSSDTTKSYMNPRWSLASNLGLSDSCLNISLLLRTFMQWHDSCTAIILLNLAEC